MQFHFNTFERDVLVRILEDYIKQRNEELEALTQAIRTAQFIDNELRNPYENHKDYE